MILLFATLSAAARPPMTAGIRYRALSIPSGLLDTWYFDEDDGAPEERPAVHGRALGVECTIEPAPTSFRFYIEHVAFGIEPGYWDDREDPPHHEDGDWVEPDGLGAVVLGADYAHEIALGDDERPVWAGILIGGGVGGGLRTGTAEKWRAGPAITDDPARCRPEADAIVRHEDCPSDGEVDLWSIVPMIDVSVGARVHIRGRAWVRLDGGLHDALFVGGAAGGEF